MQRTDTAIIPTPQLTIEKRRLRMRAWPRMAGWAGGGPGRAQAQVIGAGAAEIALKLASENCVPNLELNPVPKLRSRWY